MGETVIENPIHVKLIKRLYVTDEVLEAGKVLYCSDTLEAFFDENTRIRICLGKTSSVNTEDELTQASESNIGSFKIILDTLSLKYCDSNLSWIDVKTRDEMVKILGSVDAFEPHNLTKNGKLIAPRTRASCVYDDYGVPIGESLTYLQDMIDKIFQEGIPGELITSGTIDTDRIPKEAKFDFRPVKDTEERLSLTIDDIQNGDVIQEDSTGKMYFVIDDTKLGTEDAFKEFTVGSIPWSSVLNRPLSITLKNGAIGTALLSTSSTTDSQKITIQVKLNVDYVDAGILPITHGGTGNQTGTAAYVDFETTDLEELFIAGFRTNRKIGRSSLAKVRAGILTSSAFIADDDSINSQINNLHSGKITLDKKINGEMGIQAYESSDQTYYNLVSYTPTTGSIFGDIAGKTSVHGNKTIVRGSEEVKIQIGDASSTSASINLSKDKAEANVPLKTYDNITTYSSDGQEATIKAKGSGAYLEHSTPIISQSNRTCQLTKSSINCSDATIIKNNTGKFLFIDEQGNIGVLINQSAISGASKIDASELLIGGDAYISGIIYGTSTQAENADKLDGYHASDFMLKDGSNATNPAVLTQATAPAGKSNCIWINTKTGIASYWTGTAWTPISNTWKN